MTLRQITFALIVILVALAWAGWDRFAYAMEPGQKRGWFIAVSLMVILALAWVLKPWFVKHFMFII